MCTVYGTDAAPVLSATTTNKDEQAFMPCTMYTVHVTALVYIWQLIGFSVPHRRQVLSTDVVLAKDISKDKSTCISTLAIHSA